MSSRALIIAIVLVVAGLTIVSLRDYFTSEPIVIEAEEVQAPRILVAKRNLISGSFIQPQEDLDWQPMPAAAAPAPAQAPTNTNENRIGNMPEGEEDGGVPEVATADNNNYQYEGSVALEDFNGAVVRRTIRAGEPIVASMLMKPGEGGFMSAVLEPGKRAVSISVNPISGNAGFVSPGDRVDLLLTYRVKNSANADSGAEESVGTETFAQGVRVLAVDQSLDNPENKAILAKTITVEVTPVQAEKISVASEMGKISVALVSTAIPSVETGDAKSFENVISPAISPSKTYTMDGDVSSLLGEKENATSKVRIIRGDKIETLEFYQDKQ
ncbi:MAG: Flp pilus assembly protein CpaB [Pseudomonadota bacterium]